MLEPLSRLFDTTGFVPRKTCGEWSPALMWMHIGGDLFIWLAYLSIPLVLLYFTRRRDLPYPRLFTLFALFILACGFGHLIEALMFQYPLYRLAGVWKVVTAVVSWATVLALIPLVPRVMAAVSASARPGSPPSLGTGDTAIHRLAASTGRERVTDYTVAILAAVLALLLRAAVDDVVGSDHLYVIALLAVVFVSWQSGFGPGIVTLVISLVGMVYFFISPRHSFVVDRLGDQLATAMFFFCGVCCAALGEAQRAARRTTKAALSEALARKAELETEVALRRGAEEAIRESESRFRSLADSVPALIWLSGLDRRRTFFNKTWLAFTGRTLEQEAAGGWADHIHPDDKARYLAAYGDAFDARKPFEIEYRLRRHDGVTRWVLARGTPRFTPSGEFAGFVGLCLDVTDRKLADENLRRSEQNLADFFENANVGLHWVGPDGVILRANRAELEMLGYAREEYVGHPVAGFHADAEAIADILARLGRGERLDNFPARLRCKNGDVRDVLISSTALREGGRFVHSRCFTRDVTELKRAERAIRASEARFRTLAEAVPQIVWVTRPDGYHEYYNPRWYEYTGMTEAESIGWGWSTPLHPDDKALSEARWKRSTDTGGEYDIEYRFRGRDGNYRWFLGRALPERDESGKVVRWFGTCTDIHDAKLAAERLRASEERYRTLTEAIPQIIWNAGPDGGATYFNRQWLDYTGLPQEAALGLGWFDVVHPEDRERIAAAWRATVAPGAVGAADRFAHEVRLRHRSGTEYRWFLTVAVPLRRSDGTIDQWIGSMADIHDQKTAAGLVQEANEFLEATINALPSHLAVLDAGGTILKVNEAWRQFADHNGLLTEAYGVGSSYLEACDVPCEVAPPSRLSDGIRSVIGGDRATYRTEYPCHGPAEKRWFQMRVNRFPGDGPVRVVVAHENITDRVLAEQAVRESAERFRTLTEAMPQFVWTCRPDGECDYLSSQWVEYTGIPEAEQLGTAWVAQVHPDDRDRLAARWGEAIEHGGNLDVEFRIRRRDNVYRWFKTRAVPHRDAGGAVLKWIGTNTDIEDTKQAEAGLRAAVERFRTLTEAVPQMVWTADPKGGVTFFNRRWDAYTGVPLEKARSSGWADAVHPDDAEQLRAEWQLAIVNQPEQFTDEFRLRRAGDGAYRWMLSTAVPLRDPGGAVAEWVGSITDIDDQKRYAENLERTVLERTAALVEEVEERKRAEQQVRAVAAELERSNKELESFAYIASHDLQEPLRKIQAFGNRLTTKYRDALPDAGKEYVDRMEKSAGRMRRLIDDLLSFSRVTTQARPFDRVDLAQVAAEVAGDLSERIEASGGEVKLGPLPTIDADPMQMRQLFQNLIANAVKFQRPGVPPVVEVFAESVAEPLPTPDDEPVPAYRIIVRDNGIGFDEKYLDRIFQVFQRLHGKEEYEGTGVGLAICRKIAERHGGTITARSRVGEGTAFLVTLPARHQYPRDPSLAEPAGDRTRREDVPTDGGPDEETRHHTDGG